MKKIILNPINYLVLIILGIIMLVANHYVNIKPNLLINEAYKDLCSQEEKVQESHLEKCETLEREGKAVKLDFFNAYSNLQYETLILAVSIIIILLIVSTIRFHRYVHSEYAKYMLTREKYKKFIKKETFHSLFTCYYLYTVHILTVLVIAYFSSETYNVNYNIDFFTILTGYFNTILYFTFAILIAIVLLKKINNLVLFVLIVFLTMIAIHVGFEIVSIIMSYITKNHFLRTIFDNFVKPMEHGVKFYFIPQILINIIPLFIIKNVYKNKEGFIIEMEK